jgi:DNA-directed RNA polymerase subunit RPC12/RpoP
MKDRKQSPLSKTKTRNRPETKPLVETSIPCPRCQSARFINKAGHARGVQLYRCTRCKFRFIEHIEKPVFGERMPWPADYFDGPPRSCSPIVDMGVERGQARRCIPERGAA